MRLVPTGRASEVREVLDIKRCAGCQGILASPHITLGWLSCLCVGGPGHRVVHCLDCDTANYDPTHDETVQNVVGGAGMFES